MSSLKGTVGARKIRWTKAPLGTIGQGEVEIDGKRFSVSWRRDADGVWIELPHGCFGFDFYGEADDAGSALSYRVSERGSDTLFEGFRFKGDGEGALAGAQAGKKRSVRVRAQMPGKVVKVLVKSGDAVTKDQPLLVMEAMKMENEIRASSAGKVSAVKANEGQAVETGADLILID
jgi:acetyl/propionyl-CoA carboxylase alpha subunit